MAKSNFIIKTNQSLARLQSRQEIFYQLEPTGAEPSYRF